MIKIENKFRLIHEEKNLGIRYGSFKFNGGRTFTNQKAKSSTDLNYLPEINKFDQSKISYPGSLLVAHKKIDVEKLIHKDSQYYAEKIKELKVYSTKCKEDYKVCKPILGVYKLKKFYNSLTKQREFKKKFYSLSMFPDLINGKTDFITKVLVDLALDSGYDALSNSYKFQAFKAQEFVSDTKVAIKERDNLVSMGLREIDILPEVLLSAKSNKEFEQAVKFVYGDNSNFNSLDFSYASRIRNKYNYDSIIDLNRKNENIMNILSNVSHRKMPEKGFNLAPAHYYPVYKFDVIVKGMPASFLSEEQPAIKFFEKETLGIIPEEKKIVLSPDFNTSFPLLSTKDFGERQEFLKKAKKANMLRALSKSMEFFDSQEELAYSRDYVADDSFRDYLGEKEELKKAFEKHNHLNSQADLSGW